MVKKTVEGTRGILTRPWLVMLWLLILATLSLEFFIDLKRQPVLAGVSFVLDIILIVSYFTIVMRKIFARRVRLTELIRQDKADLVYFILVMSFIAFPRVAAGLIIVRCLIALFMRVLEGSLGTKVLAELNLRPSQTLALSFIGLIAAGTALLTFPAATTDGKGATFINALFTMTSASCVAGLTVHNIGTDFSRFGQAVIMFGMQAGGLGIMFLSAAFAAMVGGSVAGTRKLGYYAALDASTPEGLKSLVRAIAYTTMLTEFLGTIGLFIAMRPVIPVTSERLWWSVFHAISAFCSAGLSLSPLSLNAFVNDIPVCLVFLLMIYAGGIGFFVIADLTDAEVWRVKRPRALWGRLQMQTKVVLTTVLILDILGTLLFLFFEYDGALRGLDVTKKIFASFFHAVSLRSAGFTLVPLGEIAGATVIFCVAFMFIGASPGSAGGGIKNTTAAVSIMALRAMLRGRKDVELFGRRIDSSVISRSLSIVIVAAMIVAVFLTMLLATQEISFEKLLFEAVAAFGTAGMSMNTTELLDNTGKFLVIILMYVGRIGPLTLALAIGERASSPNYRLPKGSIAVG
jgi:trk system potassium uptake protein TrkH